MKRSNERARGSLEMKSIFRCMMEEGYYPTYEQTHILFNIDDNIAVLEYEENVLSVRLFFSIDKDAYDIFLEASNAMMTETFMVKPAILDDMKNIMFSCEIPCDTLKEFRKFLPRCVERLTEALMIHKAEMKKIILTEEVTSSAAITTEDPGAGIFDIKGRKMVS